MSRKSDLPNDKKTIRKIVKRIGELDIIDKVYIGGSRSPKSKREPRKESDWDLIAVKNVEHKVLLDHPRQTKQAHADLIVLDKKGLKLVKKAVEIYPKDKHKILK